MSAKKVHVHGKILKNSYNVFTVLCIIDSVVLRQLYAELIICLLSMLIKSFKYVKFFLLCLLYYHPQILGIGVLFILVPYRNYCIV